MCEESIKVYSCGGAQTMIKFTFVASKVVEYYVYLANARFAKS